MTYQTLTPKHAEQLQNLLEAYNVALRDLPVQTIWYCIGIAALGRLLGRRLTEIHPLLTLIFLGGLVVLITYLIKREAAKRKARGIQTAWEMKREMKDVFGLTPNDARAVLARLNGPTVLDSLAAANAKNHAESAERRNILKRFQT